MEGMDSYRYVDHQSEELVRYAAVGVNSFNSDPDVFAKITPEVKSWIQSVAEGTEDSDC